MQKSLSYRFQFSKMAFWDNTNKGEIRISSWGQRKGRKLTATESRPFTTQCSPRRCRVSGARSRFPRSELSLRVQTHSNGMMVRFRGTISIKSARARSLYEANHNATAARLSYCWIECFCQLYGTRTHISDCVHTTRFYGKGWSAHIVTVGYVLQ